MRSPDFLTAVGIGVADLERSTRYYEQVLGMTKIRTFEVEYMDEVMLAHEGRNAVVLMHYTDGSVRNYRTTRSSWCSTSPTPPRSPRR